MVFNKDMKLLLDENSYKQHDSHPQIEIDIVEKHNYTLKVVFVEHHTHFNVYVSQRSQIQFED